MVRIELITEIAARAERCFDLSRSVEVHLLGTEGTGEAAVGGVRTGLIGMGDSVRWRAKHLGVWQHLSSRITAYERPGYFQDTMVEGAFRSMVHDHFFREIGPGRTEMRDLFRFAAPVPGVGWVVEKMVLRRYMLEFLQTRNGVLKGVAEGEGWERFLPGARQ